MVEKAEQITQDTSDAAMKIVKSAEAKSFKSAFKSFKPHKDAAKTLCSRMCGLVPSIKDELQESHDEVIPAIETSFKHASSTYAMLAVAQSALRDMKSTESREVLLQQAQTCVKDLGVDLPAKFQLLLGGLHPSTVEE